MNNNNRIHNKEYLYYNFRITNNENIYKLVDYKETRTVPILNNSSDYEIAVERFTIPYSSIPIFIWKSNDLYKIKMVYNNDIITKPLIYNGVNDTIYNNNGIWSYQVFIDIINIALFECFADLKALYPALPITKAPFITFNSKNSLMTWNIPKSYENLIKVYFNVDLYYLLVSFQAFELTIDDEQYFEMVCKDNVFNSSIIDGVPFYSTKQEYPTLSLIQNFQSIIFETDNIPVNSEQIADQVNSIRSILTDFEPIQEQTRDNELQYFPRGPLRFYDLDSFNELRKMDLKVFWSDKQNNIYPLYINKNKILSLKLLLRKKNYMY